MLDLSGGLPSDNCGDVKIKLTEASAAALEKVEGLDTWTVLPTMIRGAKGHAAEIAASEPPLRRHPKIPAKPAATARLL